MQGSILDKLASLSMIVASVVLTTVATSIYVARPRPVLPYGVGDRFATEVVPSTHPTKSALVLWVSSSCPYCQASMAFYRRLSVAPGRRVALIAMAAESEASLRSFLAANDLNVDLVIGGVSDPRLKATPTLLLLDPRLVVVSAWTGMLQEGSTEDQVISAVRQ